MGATSLYQSSVDTFVGPFAANIPPVVGPLVGGGVNTNYSEQAAAVVVDGSIPVTDADSATLVGATVRIASGFQSGDTLHFTDQSGIVGHYDAVTHVLTLTGSATVAQYQAALQSVTFDNLTNDDPTADATDFVRGIAWQVDDGTDLSNLYQTLVGVAAVNDAPVNTVPGTQHAVANVDHAIAGLAVSDVDAGSASLTTTLTVDHGILVVASAGGALVSGSGTDTVTLNGTVAQINTTLAAADNVVYRGAGADDTLAVQTDDNGHTGMPQSDTDVVAIDLGVAPPLVPHGGGQFDSDHSAGHLLRRDDGTLRIDDVNGSRVTAHVLGAVGTEWRVLGAGDFNGDGVGDILSQRATDHMVAVHSIANDQVASHWFIGQVGDEWNFLGIGDFNHDGTSDLLWQRRDGTLLVHDIQSNQVVGTAQPGRIGTEWHFLAIDDFNHDGTSDLLWRRDDGMLLIQDMQSNRVSASVQLGQIGSEWLFAGTGDFTAITLPTFCSNGRRHAAGVRHRQQPRRERAGAGDAGERHPHRRHRRLHRRWHRRSAAAPRQRHVRAAADPGQRRHPDGEPWVRSATSGTSCDRAARARRRSDPAV